MRRRPGAVPPGLVLPPWARQVLGVQAALFGVTGLALLLIRGVMVDAWP
jgi:hypothetical protein